MKTNEIKKGQFFLLANGWRGEMMDNKKGNIRVARVFGYYTEIGSVYAHDIVAVEVGDNLIDVEHTPAQLKLKAQVENYTHKNHLGW